METLITVNNLTVSFGEGVHKVNVVDDIGFRIRRGETFVLLGESGSGKSITALSLMRLLPTGAHIEQGKIMLNGPQSFHLVRKQDARYTRGAYQHDLSGTAILVEPGDDSGTTDH